jgi:hypothetical protein
MRCSHSTPLLVALAASRSRKLASLAARQRAVIKARTPDEDRQLAARVNVGDHRSGVSSIPRRGVLLGGIGNVDEVMRDAAPFSHRDLVGADVEASIHGGRVAVDDLAVESFGDGDSERALPRRGRPEDRDEWLHWPGGDSL